MKKDVALFSIWILLFATFGPVAIVNAVDSADSVLRDCNDCGYFSTFCSANECIKINDEREELGLIGCVYDTYLINECMPKESSIRECNTCGRGLFTKCGRAECEDIIGTQREAKGLTGCKYDTKWMNECLETDETELTDVERAERIEENGGKCFGPDKSTCVVCQNTLSETFDHCCETTYEYSIGYDVVRTDKKIEWKGNCQYDKDVISQYGFGPKTNDAFAKTGNEYISKYTIIEHLDLDVCRKNAVNKVNSAVRCDVINFNLPQKVSKAEEIILSLGDPKYITYWQSFPQGESSSWDSLVKWHENWGMLVLTAIPFGSALKGVKGIKGMKIGTEVEVAEELAEEAAPGFFQRILSMLGKESGEGVDMAVIDQKATRTATNLRKAASKEPKLRIRPQGSVEESEKYLATKIDGLNLPASIKNKAISKFTDSDIGKVLGKMYVLKSKTPPTWSMVKAGLVVVGAEATTLSAWNVDRLISQESKYEPFPNTMTLFVPFNLPQQLELGKDAKRMMVLLDKAATFDTTAYLASPCRANFEVSISDECYCDAESYKRVDGDKIVNSKNKVIETLIDNPDTPDIDESTAYDGLVTCNLVTPGHELGHDAGITISGGLNVMYLGAKKTISEAFGDEEGAKNAYYSLKSTSEGIYSAYKEKDTYNPPCIKIKDTWHDTDGNNFCYATADGVGTAVLVGSLVADAIVIVSSAGTGTELAVGITAAAVTYYAEHTTAWPGHNPVFWH